MSVPSRLRKRFDTGYFARSCRRFPFLLLTAAHPSLPEDIVRFHTAVLVARAHNRYTQRVARHCDPPAETKRQTLTKLIEVVSLNHVTKNNENKALF